MQIPHATARNVRQISGIHERFAAEAGEHETHEFGASRLDRETRRQRGGGIQIINAAGLAVSLKQFLNSVARGGIHRAKIGDGAYGSNCRAAIFAAD
jgi:hypothetical protein